MKKKTMTVGAIIAINAITEHGDRSYAGFTGNFSKLKSACEAMGIKYDPDNELLVITNLIIIIDLLYAKNKAVIDLLSPYKAALLSRNAAFELMSVLKTQILNALKASKNVTDAEVLIAVNYGKKVDGVRIIALKKTPVPPTAAIETAAIVEDEVEEIEKHSVSYQKFEIRLNNFLIFFTYVTGLACYSTKKTSLKLAVIQG